MKVIASIIGIIIYNFFFAWFMYITKDRMEPGLFSFCRSDVYGYILISLTFSFLIFIPLTKLLWNRFIVHVCNVKKISLVQSLYLYSLLVLGCFILRQHNFLLLIMVLQSGL